MWWYSGTSGITKSSRQTLIRLITKSAGRAAERVYRTRSNSVDHLKRRYVEEWHRFDHIITERAVQQWRVWLRACVFVKTVITLSARCGLVNNFPMLETSFYGNNCKRLFIKIYCLNLHHVCQLHCSYCGEKDSYVRLCLSCTSLYLGATFSWITLYAT